MSNPLDTVSRLEIGCFPEGSRETENPSLFLSLEEHSVSSLLSAILPGLRSATLAGENDIAVANSAETFRSLECPSTPNRHLNPGEAQQRSIRTFRGNRKSIQKLHLVVSRGPELETRSDQGQNTTISRCFGRYAKRSQRRKSLRIWSGLPESNRHLNLGKSAGKGLSTTYEALSGALSSI